MAAAADGLDGMWRPARGAAVIELHGMSGCEVPVAAWCAETCPVRREECLQIGDRWSVECGGEGLGYFVPAGRITKDGLPLRIYGPPLAPRWASDFSQIIHPAAQPVDYTFFPLLLRPAMALIHLNSIHHYRPPQTIVRPVKGRSAASNRGASKVSHEHNDTVAITSNFGSSAGLKDYELIECVDLTDSLPMETVDLFGEPTLAFGGTEGCVQGKVHYPSFRWLCDDDF